MFRASACTSDSAGVACTHSCVAAPSETTFASLKEGFPTEASRLSAAQNYNQYRTIARHSYVRDNDSPTRAALGKQGWGPPLPATSPHAIRLTDRPRVRFR